MMDGGRAPSDSDCDSQLNFTDDDIVINPSSVAVVAKSSDRPEYQVLDAKEVVSQMNVIISEVAEIVHLPLTVCRLLLHHYKWNKESLLERFYDAPDTDAFFADANIVSPFKVCPRASDDTTEVVDLCAICCDSSRLTGLLCCHRFCYSCWDSYITTKVMEDGRTHIACPQVGCPIVVDDERALSWISSEKVRKRYRHLMINSFVECHSLLRWCPGPNCGRVVMAQHSDVLQIKCTCGMVFCFGCGHEWHEPVNCRLLKLWLKKCSDDSETGNWIVANTKECPKCQAVIEKDGGCNHMTCKNAACKMEFCWVCLGPWEPHGSSWYSCNRFDDSQAKLARDAQEKSRATLQRYLHYYNRYMNHQQSLKLEHKLYAVVKSKMEALQQAGMSWIEVQFLRKAVDVLSECRRTLMYSYAFAFYLQKNNQCVIFEDNQRDLEHATEQLSEFLERDLKHENLTSLKQKVQDKYRYVSQRRTALLKHCLEGVENDFWRFTI